MGRYFLVGLWNTAFAYGSYAFFTAILDRHMPASYMAGSALSSVLNITVSFLGYKWFVFRTSGNYMREWWRALMVYGGSILLGLVFLPPAVFAVRSATGNAQRAPYIAGLLLLAGQIVLSFLGHRRFTFRQTA